MYDVSQTCVRLLLFFFRGMAVKGVQLLSIGTQDLPISTRTPSLSLCHCLPDVRAFLRGACLYGRAVLHRRAATLSTPAQIFCAKRSTCPVLS